MTLNDTLIDALSQCREQTRLVEEQAARISELQKENERLRQELKQRVAAVTQPRAQNSNPDFDVQKILQRSVEAQAEIAFLKKRVRSYKDKLQTRMHSPVSSPVISSPQVRAVSSPAVLKPNENKHSIDDPVWTSATSHTVPAVEGECAQSCREETAKDVPGAEVQENISTSSSNTLTNSAFRRRRARAIIELAEDGDDLVLTGQSTRDVRSGDRLTFGKLDALLSTPGAAKSVLDSTNVLKRVQPPEAQGSHKRARASDVDLNAIEYKDTSKTATLARHSNIRSRKFGSNIRNRDDSGHGNLRSRPIEKLTLLSFKPNPKWLDTHQMTYADLIRGKEGERMRRIVETLPRIPGQVACGGPMTDHELLLEFLGPGSESRIANLTRVARDNLLVEARTQKVAQAFANKTAHFDRELDPPGFWDVDMPGTQKEEENRKAAREQEREEVKRRYADAIRGEGKWVFADE